MRNVTSILTLLSLSLLSGTARADSCFPVDGKDLCLSSNGMEHGLFTYIGTRDGKSVKYVRRAGVLYASSGKPDELPVKIEVTEPHPRLWRVNEVRAIRVGTDTCNRASNASSHDSRTPTSVADSALFNTVAPSNVASLVETAQTVTPALPDGLKLPPGIGHIARLASAPGKSFPIYALAHKIGRVNAAGTDTVLLRSNDGVTWDLVIELPQVKNGTAFTAGIAVAPGGQIFIARADGILRYDANTGKSEFLDELKGVRLTDIKVSADGKHLAVTGNSTPDAAALFDLAPDGRISNRRDFSRGAEKLAALTVEFDPNGNLIFGSGASVGEEKLNADGKVTNMKDLRSEAITYCDVASGTCRDASKGIYFDSLVYNFSVVGDKVYTSTCNKPYWTTFASLRSGDPQWHRSTAKVPGNGGSNVSPYMRNYFVEARPGHPNQVVAGAQQGFYLSNDGGATWKLIRNEATAGGVRLAQWLDDGSVVISSWEKGASRVPASELGIH